jgi:hypothetical protein
MRIGKLFLTFWASMWKLTVTSIDTFITVTTICTCLVGLVIVNVLFTVIGQTPTWVQRYKTCITNGVFGKRKVKVKHQLNTKVRPRIYAAQHNRTRSQSPPFERYITTDHLINVYSRSSSVTKSYPDV